MSKHLFVIILLFSISSAASAQGFREGYFLNSTLSGYWNPSDKIGGVGLNVVNGWHFTNRLSAGVGVGVNSFTYVSLPLSVKGYYFFIDRISSPYISADISYPITIEKHVHAKGKISPEVSLGWTFKVGGVTMGPEIGYRNERLQQRQLGFAGRADDGTFIYEDLGYSGFSLHYIKFSYSVFF